jgi:hypothetical protein
MRTILFLLSLLPAVACAQELKIPEATYPSLPESGKVLTDFIPKGWDKEFQVSGDLNKDGIDDIALVLHENNPKNIIKNSSSDNGLFNTNPRILVVLFGKNGGGYSLAVDNHTLIPRHDDPNYDEVMNGILVGGIEIKRGSLRVLMGVFPLLSSAMKNVTYTFRWKDQYFELIGYDQSGQNRASGESKDISVNFLTKKIKVACESNDPNDKGQIKWSKLTQARVWTVDSIANSLSFVQDDLGLELSCQ